MIVPETNDLISLETIPYANRTYRINHEQGRIIGMIDGEEALMQAAKKILATQRFAHVIYDDNYGNELVYLVGKDYNYIVSEIQRMLTDAFSADTRFIGIENLAIEQTSLDAVTITFTVLTTEESRLSLTSEVQIT